KGEFIGGDKLQSAAGEGTINSKAGNLLPEGAGLLVPHEEVLVVDAGQMESQRQPVDSTLKHQTGVTERSISGDDRFVCEHIVNDVMVRHAADGISSRVRSYS